MNTTETNQGHEKKFEAKEKHDSTNKDGKTKKGFWTKYTDRLKKSHCTRNPPECR